METISRSFSTRRRFCSALGVCFTSALSGSALAQSSYPSRAVRLIVPFAAGGTTDSVGRSVAEVLRSALGVPVIVENRPGAATLLAATELAKAPADGHHLMLASSVTYASAPPLAEGSKFKPQELVAAAMLGDVVVVLAGRPDLPASSIRELVQRLKEAPSKFKYASTGVGTPSHLLMESLIAKMGLSITHIPYNSSPQLLTDLMGGNGGDFALLDPMLAAEQIKSGRLKGIAVTGRKRWSVLPSLPAFAEEFPDLDQQAWMTVSAPAQTPRAILERVNAIVSNAIQKTDLGDELRLKGLEPRSLDVEELNRFISAEIVRWGELVKRFATKS